jgi:CheY-like chemotaxis protein
MLPVGLPVAAGSGTEIAPSAVTVRCKRVLIVDDEPEVAATLADLLRLDGHLIDTVANGRLAVDKLANHDYDLILSDVKMPELNGAGFRREVAQRRPDLLSPFVFLTGDGLSADTAAILAKTGTPTIAKPLDVADIRRVSQRILGAQL